ncbi:MAG: hypothetical protein ACWA5P_01485 [bacterium]
MKLLPINKGFLLIGITTVGLLLLFSFLPWIDANYQGEPSSDLQSFLVSVFNLITWPSNNFKNGIIVWLIPLINIILYGLLIERFLSYLIYRTKN